MIKALSKPRPEPYRRTPKRIVNFDEEGDRKPSSEKLDARRGDRVRSTVAQTP